MPALARRLPPAVWGGLLLMAVVPASSMVVVYRARGVEVAWIDALITSLMDWGLWVPLLPGIVAWCRVAGRHRLPLHLALHVVGGAAFSCVQLAAFATLTLVVRGFQTGQESYLDLLRNAFAFKFHTGGLVYGALVLGFHALVAEGRRREATVRSARLDEQLVTARLQALQVCLRPHFLFNTLNTIAAMVRESPDTAERMCSGLGDLLRAALRHRDASMIPVAEELALADDFLAIQRARFGEGLRTELRIDDGADAAHVPPLLLQPLVENAVRHGMDGRGDGLTVGIGARRSGEHLVLSVRDDGAGFDGDPDALLGRGFGLTSTRDRLALCFGDDQRMEVRRSPGRGTEVTLELPWRTSEESA